MEHASSSLVGVGPRLFTSSLRVVWRDGQLRKGEPLIGACKEEVELCSRAIPAPGILLLPSCPGSLHGLCRWLTAVVLLLTFKKGSDTFRVGMAIGLDVSFFLR